jgi:hypothetical protein
MPKAMVWQLRARGGRLLSATHVVLYRVTKGTIGARFGRRTLLLLTTTGRKSGKQRTRPLQSFMDGESHLMLLRRR